MEENNSIKTVVTIHDVDFVVELNNKLIGKNEFAYTIDIADYIKTVNLKNTKGYNIHNITVFDNFAKKAANYITNNNIHIDCIYIGILGNEKNVNEIIKFIDFIRANESVYGKTLVVVNPSLKLGFDNYFFDYDIIDPILNLISKANVLTLSFYDLALILKKNINVSNINKRFLNQIAKNFLNENLTKIIITDIPSKENIPSIYVEDSETGIGIWEKIESIGSFSNVENIIVEKLIECLLEGNLFSIALDAAKKFLDSLNSDYKKFCSNIEHVKKNEDFCYQSIKI